MEHHYIQKLEDLGALIRFRRNCELLNEKGYIGVVLRLQFQTEDGAIPSFNEFIYSAFSFSETPEGRKYWKRIANSY